MCALFSQIISADLNEDLERSMADLLATLPRAVSDADRVSDLTRALADDLERIDSRLVKVRTNWLTPHFHSPASFLSSNTFP